MLDPLAMQASPFGSAQGLPSLSGGDAAPSNATALSGKDEIFFASPFSVSGNGGYSQALSNPDLGNISQSKNWALYGVLALAGIFILKKVK